MGSNEKVAIEVGITNKEEFEQKLERYVELLKEAKSLANEIASMDITPTINEV